MESEDTTSREQNATTPIEYKRLPDDQFFESYANNVFLEPTGWDLKLIFGNVDLAKGANTVVQHSAMTLPWSQIKAGIYFLQIHLAVHEIFNGRVNVPRGVIRPPVPPTEEQEREDPRARKAFEAAQELFRRFSEANPESF
jgi:hypothetical protein